MQLHVESSDPAAIEFCEMLGALGLAQQHVAQLFGVGLRNVRRWRSGDRRIPHGVGIVLRLLAAGTVTVAQVEQAAVPARANSGVKVEPLASLLVDPAPEQSALAHASTATADARATRVFVSPSVSAAARYGRRPPRGSKDHHTRQHRGRSKYAVKGGTAVRWYDGDAMGLYRRECPSRAPVGRRE